jgi:hypothetical protein
MAGVAARQNALPGRGSRSQGLRPVAQEADDLLSAGSVEVAGRLVGEDEPRVKRAGEGVAHGATACDVTTKGRRALAQSVRADRPLPGIASD